jgi:hypothetical protein
LKCDTRLQDAGQVEPHISILNSTYEPSDVRQHQYLCGFERDEDALEAFGLDFKIAFLTVLQTFSHRNAF